MITGNFYDSKLMTRNDDNKKTIYDTKLMITNDDSKIMTTNDHNNHNSKMMIRNE